MPDERSPAFVSERPAAPGWRLYRCPARSIAVLLALLAWPLRGLAAADEASSSEAPAPSGGVTGSVFVDPLGFAMFGPMVGAELAIGSASVIGYGRWLDAGLLAQRMLPNRDEDEHLAFSYGAGVRGRYYLMSPLAGPHLGVGLEYLDTRTEDDEVDLTVLLGEFLVPQLDAGYRHSFGGAFVGGVAALGYAIELSAEMDNLPGGNRAHLFEPGDSSTIYGNVGVEIGISF